LQRERIITHLVVTSLSLCSVTGVLAAKNYSDRNKLAHALKPALCKKERTEDLHHIAWEQGIYDAGIEISLIKRRDKGALSTGKLRSFAIWQMKQNYHHGFGFAKCSDERAFIVSVPSTKPFQFTKDGKSLVLPKTSHSCRKVHAKYVAIKGGSSKPLKLSKGRSISIANLEPGMLSISCQPKAPKWLGPILWFLVPIQLKQFPELPHAKLLASGQDAQQQLQTWVNHARRHAGLVPLNFTKQALKDAASELALSKKLFHDRGVMKQVKTSLADEEFSPLGEDRARAATLSRIAWSLWHSPSHRDLLLNKNADLAGMSLSKSEGAYFMVLMTAQSDKVTVSKRK